VGDNDELRVLLQLGEYAGEAARIGLVEGGVDLVEHDEGAGVDAHNGGHEGDAGQGPLAAR